MPWGRSAWPTRGRCFTRSGVEIVDGPRTLKERHLKMTFSQEGRRFRAIAWRAAERADFLTRNRAGVNLAFSLEQNEFQGETYLELNVADFKSLASRLTAASYQLQLARQTSSAGSARRRSPMSTLLDAAGSS